MIVKNHESLNDIGNDLSYLCWTVAIASTIGFVLVLTCKFTIYRERSRLIFNDLIEISANNILLDSS